MGEDRTLRKIADNFSTVDTKEYNNINFADFVGKICYEKTVYVELNFQKNYINVPCDSHKILEPLLKLEFIMRLRAHSPFTEGFKLT